ncbi:DUF2760 domain-containing protein [Bryobacter aggregatus]|uniref:DUF2760 domain-containing protein n=1 Tax=Bryobacter aggregatus TaxID=360054 RepID=UPI00068EDE34|nr:DUF2760 domain-containing protein [Bryobacter aggregatus]
MSRISLAFSSFFGLLFGGQLPDSVIAALGLSRRTASRAEAKPAPVATVATSDGALQLLSVLQRDARLLDFLMEDISPYADEQIGAAVRSIHENSRASLLRYLSLQPIIDGVEGATTQLSAAGALKNDVSAIKLLGNVPADGNVKAGVLRHKGWKVDKIDLPHLPAKANLKILAPAEIEVE